MATSTRAWAETTFGTAGLGDARRTRRLVRMAQRAASAPAGQITQVFPKGAERQAAYDFLEHAQVPVTGVCDALCDATTRACARAVSALVILDGSSLTLTDAQHSKGFGRIGHTFGHRGRQRSARGLKVITGYALDAWGVPIGVMDQRWWIRPEEHARRTALRPPHARESAHWRRAIDAIEARALVHAPDTRLHFLVDREGDASLLLDQLVRSRHDFTIRSNATRVVPTPAGRVPIRDVLRREPVLTQLALEVPARGRRPARVAHLDVRAATLPVSLRDQNRPKRRWTVHLTVVWARERCAPRGVTPLEWMLFTTTSVRTADDASQVIGRYSFRWRIEDFHRTWKSGLCCTEDSQLRSPTAMIKWATILAAVASRAEHLRHCYRATPTAPASTEFTDDELTALEFTLNEDRKVPLRITRDLPLFDVIRFVAEAGGWVRNKRTHPGATTLARGLQQVDRGAALLKSLRAAGRLR